MAAIFAALLILAVLAVLALCYLDLSFRASAKRALRQLWNGFEFALWITFLCAMLGLTSVWGVACYFLITGEHAGWGVVCVACGLAVIGDAYLDLWNDRPTLAGGDA